MSATDWSELDGYEGLVSELRADPPVAPERLRQRVLGLAPAARPRMSRRRRLALVVVPVAVALAVGAAVIHGFVSSGSAPRGEGTSGLVTAAPNSSAQRATPPTTNTKAFSGEALAPKRALTIPQNRLVHADASLAVRVPSKSKLSQATSQATKIVTSLGGYAQSVRYQSSHGGGGSAYLALRVPVRKAETAIAKLGALGTLLSQQVSTKDLEQQLTRHTNQIGSLRRSIAVYEQALQSGTLSAAQRVQIQIRLENARHALTQQRKARTGTLESGATADVSLMLTTKQHVGIVGGHHKQGRFGRMLGSAAGFLGLEGMIVLYALVVLSPVLVLGGLAWALLRERRRRGERRLLAEGT
jgi:hypothetical protein